MRYETKGCGGQTQRQMDAESSCGDGGMQEAEMKRRDVGIKGREMEGSIWRDREIQGLSGMEDQLWGWRDEGPARGDKGGFGTCGRA